MIFHLGSCHGEARVMELIFQENYIMRHGVMGQKIYITHDIIYKDGYLEIYYFKPAITDFLATWRQ